MQKYICRNLEVTDVHYKENIFKNSIRACPIFTVIVLFNLHIFVCRNKSFIPAKRAERARSAFTILQLFLTLPNTDHIKKKFFTCLEIDHYIIFFINTVQQKKILYPSLTNTKHQKKFLYLPRSWFHIHLDKNNFFTHILTFSRYLILTKTLHQKKFLYLKLAITELTKSMFPWVNVLVNHVFLSKIFNIWRK